MSKKKNKNVSKTIRNGTLIMTRDEFFEDNNGYEKPKYKGTEIKYRDSIVVDSNREDELALIKIQSGGTEFVINKAGQKELYSLHIKIKDDEGNPIKLGDKFERGNSRFDVSEANAKVMRDKATNAKNRKARRQNRRALAELKGSKNKKES